MGRLVISRRIGESLKIGDDVTVTVVETHGGQVRISIDAPTSVKVHRQEVWERIQKEKDDAYRNS